MREDKAAEIAADDPVLFRAVGDRLDLLNMRRSKFPDYFPVSGSHKAIALSA